MLYECHVRVADVRRQRVERLQALSDPAQQHGRHGGPHAFDVYLRPDSSQLLCYRCAHGRGMVVQCQAGQQDALHEL
jgi:hypothetical protein